MIFEDYFDMRPTCSRALRAAVIIYMIVSLTVLLPARPAHANANVGQPAPALVVPELSGQTFDLSALRGKVVVINFWATRCEPCRQEMPALDAFYRQYHTKGVEMIGISADRPHERSNVSKVMQSFSYPVAMLDDVKEDDFGDPTSLPVTFIIDGTGVVRAKFTPEVTLATQQSLSAAILPLLPDKPAAPISTPRASAASP
jgi:cytochrome c biogenesis protein CcmG/thiol:disulfide interchange protein DsbE